MPQSTEVKVPDIGDFGDIEIIEVAVGPGDRIALEQGLITQEDYDREKAELLAQY